VREVPEIPDAGILRLAGDERVRAILAALADGPLRPADLHRRTRCSRETLYNRLHELTEIHMISASRSRTFPFAARYEFTHAGRVAYSKALLMAREQRRVLAPERANGGDDIHELLRLLAPVLHLDTPGRGTCLLVENPPSGQVAEACLLIDERTITLLKHSPTGTPDATVQGAKSAWERALTHSELGELEIEGDPTLAHAVLGALHTALAL
jgi:DNA-binding HxlR family transcriptional regulator